MWVTLYILLSVGQPGIACLLCLASQGAVVMIGNSVLEPAATHNQTLPTITFESLLGLQDHWCFWSFGAGPYQCLPIFTMDLIWAGSWPTQPLPPPVSAPTHRHRHRHT